MGRKKTISDEALLQIVIEMVELNPSRNLKIPEIGTYARNKGIHINDFTIRRCRPVRDFIEDFNNRSIEACFSEVASFRSIDPDAFLAHNTTRDKLKKALMERDSYYAAMTNHATEIFKERRKLAEENERLKQKISELKTIIAKREKKEIRSLECEKDAIIRKLKGIIDDYVNPAMAISLLEAEGIAEPVQRIISSDAMDKVVDSTSDLSVFRNTIVNELAKELEEK